MDHPRLRTFLILGRVSNLPTVWSNCATAWVLSGGNEWSRFALVLASGSSLYLGGMFLNDACDAEFDRRHRQERPIPMGSIPRGKVLAWGLALLLAGALLAVPLGYRALGCALALMTAIIAYDLWHKQHPITTGLMAACRGLLYLFAGIAAAGMISGHLMEAAGGMGVYILGTTLLARHETNSSHPPKWTLLLLAMPLAPAVLNISGGNLPAGVACAAVFVAWLAVAVAPLWQTAPQTGRSVGRLLAGIILADGLQVGVAASSWQHAAAWAGLFALTLGLQRRIPAT